MASSALVSAKTKITLITGTSSGIGRLMAEFAISDGHIVILNAPRAEPLEELKTKAPDRVHIVAGDLTKSEVRERLASTVQSIGHLDYLINNAGVGFYGSLESQSFEQITSMIELNVVAPIDLTKRLLPSLKAAPRGRIINIASLAGRAGFPYLATYVASKHALVGFTKALNLELANSRVSATAICPAGINTGFAKIAAGEARAEKFNRFSEPAVRIARSIWNERDTSQEVYYPSPMAFLGIAVSFIGGGLVKELLRSRVRAKGEDLL